MNDDRTEAELGMKLGAETVTYGFNSRDLEAMGERAVRNELNSGVYGHTGVPAFSFVSAWLADAEFVRLAADSAKRDAREEATLAIAKDANDIASSASFAASAAAAAASEANTISRSNSRRAWRAEIIAAIAAIAAIVAAIAAVKGLK